MNNAVMFSDDRVVMGLLAVTLGFVFYTSKSSHPLWQKFYKWVPALFMCYFLPSLLNTFHIIDGNASGLYKMAKDYLLPCSLVLLTLSVDLQRLLALGPKALIMFLTATAGIIIGGPLAMLAFTAVMPDHGFTEAGQELWRGMSTVAGSWIGGAANQAAMKETYAVPGDLFSIMVTVDIVVANIWVGILFLFINRAEKMDAWLKADTSSIVELRQTVEKFEKEHHRDTTLADLMVMFSLAMGITSLSHWLGGHTASFFGVNFPELKAWSLDSTFLWLVVYATAGGVLLSFTKAKNLEGAGASKVGSAFLYVLIATVGMHMDITAVIKHWQLFFLGMIWIAVHAILLLTVAKLIRAPTFFICVGSQANIGGAASAPVVAAAFHPSLASVGVLMAVFGYVLGTYGAYVCAEMMRLAAGG